MSEQSQPTPHTLPPPVIDPADVQLILPSISPEDAATAASLATLALQGALYPDPLPDPLPPPMYQAGLSAAVRIGRAGDPSGEVVSESLGAYSYRVATATPTDAAMMLTDDELALIEPWTAAKVYDVLTVPSLGTWPEDWWQRDLDRIEVAP
jgi:hypothetical protein